MFATLKGYDVLGQQSQDWVSVLDQECWLCDMKLFAVNFIVRHFLLPMPLFFKDSCVPQSIITNSDSTANSDSTSRSAHQSHGLVVWTQAVTFVKCESHSDFWCLAARQVESQYQTQSPIGLPDLFPQVQCHWRAASPSRTPHRPLQFVLTRLCADSGL